MENHISVPKILTSQWLGWIMASYGPDGFLTENSKEIKLNKYRSLAK